MSDKHLIADLEKRITETMKRVIAAHLMLVQYRTTSGIRESPNLNAAIVMLQETMTEITGRSDCLQGNHEMVERIEDQWGGAAAYGYKHLEKIIGGLGKEKE